MSDLPVIIRTSHMSLGSVKLVIGNRLKEVKYLMKVYFPGEVLHLVISGL